MSQIFLIRHSAPAVEPLVQPRHWLLSDEGEVSAKEFALSIPPPPGPIYTSPEPKAVRTARILADAWKARIMPEPGLREVEGRRWTETAVEYEVSVVRYLRGELVHEWEERDAVLGRIAEAVSRLAVSQPELVVVSHGISLTLCLSWLLRVEPETLVPMWQTMRFPDLCIVDSKRKRVLRSFGQPVSEPI